MLTADQFSHLFPNCKDPEGWVDAMNEVFPKYNIDTPKRIAAFIAQCGHESGGWRVFSENLNYSAKALNAVFGKYFVRAGRDAEEYHRQPEKIANVVYANRMDNGDTDSGDGWRFRGRGPIQLTGRANYTKFSEWADLPEVLDRPDIVAEDKEVALKSALFYWDTNNLNKYSDAGDIKTLTKRINGGYIGLEDRIHHWEEALKALGAEVETVHGDDEDDSFDIDDIGVLRKGARGEGVKIMQEALGIGADGVFGPGTERALKEWQAANGLTADGIAGPASLGKLLGD
jgi:putative chitinase